MPFKSILKQLVERVHGAQGAILLDWEGEAVDHYAVIPDYDIKFIGAHMGIILYNLRKKLNEELGDEDVKGLTVDMEKKRFAIHPVDKDYFAVLVLSPESVSGLVRHEIDEAVIAIREQF
jgi:predicted regulator of Ras-like GTPase activity (Roadblock/LC7/MglB family)